MFTSASFSVSAVELPSAGKRNREGQARHLTEEDLAGLFPEFPDEKWQCVFAIAYFTGSRISEVLKLDVSDIERQFKVEVQQRLIHLSRILQMAFCSQALFLAYD